jgi:hypothetical protein
LFLKSAATPSAAAAERVANQEFGFIDAADLRQ